MKYVLGFLAAALLSVGSFAAHAEDSTAPATSASAEAAADAAMVAPIEHELADGSKLVIEGDKAFTLGADGAKVAAVDGEHKLKDGGTVTTKDGVVLTLKPAAAAPAEAAPAH